MRARALVEGGLIIAVSSFAIVVALRQGFPVGWAALGVLGIALHSLWTLNRLEQTRADLAFAEVWNRRLNEANGSLRDEVGGSAAALTIARRNAAAARRAVEDAS